MGCVMRLSKLKNSVSGASFIEYGFLISLASIASIAVIQSLGIEVRDMFGSSQMSLASQAAPANGEDVSPEPSFPDGACYEFTTGDDVWSAQSGYTCYDLLSGLDTMDASGESGPVHVKSATGEVIQGKDEITLTSFDDWYEGGIKANVTGGDGNDTFMINDDVVGYDFTLYTPATFNLGSGDDYLSYYIDVHDVRSKVYVYADTGTDTVKTSCEPHDNFSDIQVYTSGVLNFKNIDCEAMVYPQPGASKVNVDFSRSQRRNTTFMQHISVASGVDVDVDVKAGIFSNPSIVFNEGSSGSIKVVSDNAISTGLSVYHVKDASDIDNIDVSGSSEGFFFSSSHVMSSDWKFKMENGSFAWNLKRYGDVSQVVNLNAWLGMPDFDNSADSSGGAAIKIGYMNWDADMHLYSGSTLVRTMDVHCQVCDNTTVFSGGSLDFDRIVIDNGTISREISFNGSNPKFTVTEVSLYHN